MRVPLLLIVACIMILLLGAFAAQTHQEVLPEEPLPSMDELIREYSDPLPCTEFDPATAHGRPKEIVFPQEEHLRLIGRISKGVRQIAHQKGGGRWWECGKPIDVDDEQDLALKWAYRIVFLAWEYSDNGSENGVTINPWGIAGTAANESGFDICALGPWPRKWGYEHKTLRRNPRCISHPYKEIQNTMLHPKGVARWKTSGIDAAPLQQLWRCNEKGMCRPKWNRERLPPIPLKEVFSLGKGFEYNVRKMKKDSILYDTNRPWLYWPGHHSRKYDKKVTRWARKMGATTTEI